MNKRKILGELIESVVAMKGRREGKLTLRSYKVEPALLPKPSGGCPGPSRPALSGRGATARKSGSRMETPTLAEGARMGHPNFTGPTIGRPSADGFFIGRFYLPQW
jgi:hypothetical protein